MPAETAVSVRVATAERITLRPSLDLVGSVGAIPERTAVVSPQIGGWAEALEVVEGQSVQVGDVLVRLDARSAKVALMRAAAVVAEKEAALQRLKHGYLPAEIAAARQDAQKATATVEGLRNELAALKSLLDRREISPVQYQTKATAFQSAQAAAASAQERVKLLEAGTRAETIDEAQALVSAAKADQEQAQLALDWCMIASPINGVVVSLLARQGQYFDRAVPLATIMDLSEVFVQLRVPSAAFVKVRREATVDVQLTSLPGQTFHGTIDRISGQADPATGNAVVFARVSNESGALRPGFGCHARLWLPEIRDALAIPVAAVADHAGRSVVTVIRDDKAYEVEVETGVETGDLVQIVRGVSPGDYVATSGGYGLPEGTAVKVVTPSRSVGAEPPQ